MNSQPTQLAITEDGRLRIDWSDGAARLYSVRELRDACPCATCREKRQQPPPPPNVLQVITPAEARPLTLVGMTPVGHYAYSLEFSDGGEQKSRECCGEICATAM